MNFSSIFHNFFSLFYTFSWFYQKKYCIFLYKISKPVISLFFVFFLKRNVRIFFPIFMLSADKFAISLFFSSFFRKNRLLNQQKPTFCKTFLRKSNFCFAVFCFFFLRFPTCCAILFATNEKYLHYFLKVFQFIS